MNTQNTQEKQVLTAELVSSLRHTDNLICLNTYDISIASIDNDLQKYIYNYLDYFFSEWRGRIFNSLLRNKGILIEKDNILTLERINNEIFNDLILATSIGSKISAENYLLCIATLLEKLNYKYSLEQCSYSKVLYSRDNLYSAKFIDENNTGKLGIRYKLEADTNYTLYGNVFYNNSLIIEANNGGDFIEIPKTLAYEYQGEYYTSQGLDYCELVEYGGNIYELDDCVYAQDEQIYIPQNIAYFDEDSELYYLYESSIENAYGLKAYHDSDIQDKSQDSIYKIGFEVEKEDDNYRKFKKIRSIGWDAERDGSLGYGGFELVSPIYDLMNESELKNDLENISEFINAKYSSNCGGHINVSVYDKNAEQIFDLIRGYLPLLYAMYPHRIGNRYCEAKKVNEFDMSDRYEAINFTKGNILEFRIFGSVRNTKNLMFRYKLVQYMFKNQRKGAASVIRMLLTDSELKALLLTVYEADKYEKLVNRVIEFTDIYMSSRDAKTTASMILKMKQGQTRLNQLTN